MPKNETESYDKQEERLERFIATKLRTVNTLAGISLGVSIAVGTFLYSQIYSLNRELGEAKNVLGGRIDVVSSQLSDATRRIDELRADVRALDVPRHVSPPDSGKARR